MRRRQTAVACGSRRARDLIPCGGWGDGSGMLCVHLTACGSLGLSVTTSLQLGWAQGVRDWAF
jgi:hypothetical protein